MARTAKIKIEKVAVVEEGAEVTEEMLDEAVVEETESPIPAEIQATGKFEVVRTGANFAVYSPEGKAVSPRLSEEKANHLAHSLNIRIGK